MAAICAGGVFPSAIGANTPAPMVVPPVATCAGGLYMFTVDTAMI